MVFQLTPGTEAPAEMNFYLPQFRAVFMAENANLTMHNLLPARGALVRDAKAWADYLTESIRLFGDKSDVMFAAHGIPRFGTDEIVAFLTSHRDAYKFLHDQTVRLMNSGLTAHRNRRRAEAARRARQAMVQSRLLRHDEPQLQGDLSALSRLVRRQSRQPQSAAARTRGEALCRGDGRRGRRAELAAEAAKSGRAALGGDACSITSSSPTTTTRRRANSLPTSTPSSASRPKPVPGATSISPARRNLRHGVAQLPPGGMSVDVLTATTTPMLLDFAAVRVNPEKASERAFKINIELTDRNERHLITVENGVLIHEAGVSDPKAGATVRHEAPRTPDDALLAGMPAAARIASGDIAVKGDASLYEALDGSHRADRRRTSRSSRHSAKSSGRQRRDRPGKPQ